MAIRTRKAATAETHTGVIEATIVNDFSIAKKIPLIYNANCKLMKINNRC
mgnify:CR=1 FL=1